MCRWGMDIFHVYFQELVCGHLRANKLWVLEEGFSLKGGGIFLGSRTIWKGTRENQVQGCNFRES